MTSNIPIYTIGYGARSIEAFIQVLKQNDIEYLIDVRSRPYSRYKPDFSKQPLAAHLQAHDIRYVFMGDNLGGMPADQDCYTNDRVDYEKCRQHPTYVAGIERIKRAWEQQLPVALMCSEGKPETCHRALLIGDMLATQAMVVAHIDENDQIITQDDVMSRLTDGQRSLPLGPAAPPVMAVAGELLKTVFGYDEFRPFQAEIIENILQHRDTLAIMPTGSGKSLCYQLPALIFEGLTVVVSPLISLMQDQVSQLREWGITAVFLNSSLSYQAYGQTISQVRQGNVKLLYVAPETLLRPETLALLDQCRVDCLTIDEAHCISAWGHDFRPDYRELIAVRQRLPAAVCMAVTATATPRVRQDIKASLDLNQAKEFIASFNRPNLFLEARPRTDGLAQVLAFLESHREQSGIIYCATRQQVDELTVQLQFRGWSALPYHAGLNDVTRRRHQQQFTHDDVSIMVATIAFGMGIDKSNVRFIIHYNLPKNIESYYQQIGRAGRDGLRADCLLLFSYADIHTINHFIQQQHPAEQRGASLRLQALIRLAETDDCRRRPLLTYFEETYDADSCDMCDNCLAEDKELVDITEPAQKFLSCVKRTGEMFGANHIIDVLRGSKSQKVLQRRHDRLSTYGIGQEHSKRAWQHLARQFIQKELLVQDMQYGSLKLTPKAYEVFNGETVMGVMHEQPAAPARLQPEPLAYDAALFALLRAKRKELADADQVPPYVIFSDRSLIEMATYFPQSPETFAQIYGVGQAKLEKYTAVFTPLIRDYCQTNQIAENPKSAPSQPRPQPDHSPTVSSRTVTIGDRYNAGQSVVALAEELEIKPRTVLGHLLKYVQGGRPLRADGFQAMTTLSPEMQTQVLAAFAEHGADFLRPVYDALDGAVGYEELHIMRLYFLSQADVNTADA